MLNISFDPKNTKLAAALGRALMDYAGQAPAPTHSVTAPVRDDVDDPKPGNVGSAAGSNEQATSAPSTETTEASQSTTQTTASESPADTAAASYQFEQYWQNAAGDQYAGHPIDPVLGVPVDDKGFPLIDTYGVPFNEDWCQQAAKPFYASGKEEKGKWKAKVGTGKATFLDWHRMQLEAMGKQAGEESTETQEPAPTADQAAAAFGAQTNAPANDASKPTGNIGDLMAWIGEQQAAGHLAQDQIQNVYTQCGTDIAALAQPDNQTARDTVYAVLSGMVGA